MNSDDAEDRLSQSRIIVQSRKEGEDLNDSMTVLHKQIDLM